MLVYFGRFRIGKSIKFRLENIDLNRKVIHIKASKWLFPIYTHVSTKNLSIIKKSLDSPLKEDKI